MMHTIPVLRLMSLYAEDLAAGTCQGRIPLAKDETSNEHTLRNLFQCKEVSQCRVKPCQAEGLPAGVKVTTTSKCATS